MASPSVVTDNETRAVPLELFCGTNTEMSPTDLPEGVSPDNQDVVFIPGSTLSRPCTRRLLLSPLPGLPTMRYMKTFLQNNGVPLNLYLDSNGALWKEDVFATPGLVTQISTVVPGSRAKSVTIDGAEYTAFSDGIQGADVPRQYDGVNFDRISQDGPGGGPSIANYAIPAQALIALGPSAAVVITSITPTDPETVIVGHDVDFGPPRTSTPIYETFYTTLTVVTAAPHLLTAGNTVAIAGNGVAEFNNVAAIVTVIVNATTFKYAHSSPTAGAGLGGTSTAQGPILSRTANQVSGTTALPHNLQVGYQLIISGVADVSLGGGINGITRLSNISTITTAAAHGLVAGAIVDIAGAAAGYNQNNAVVLSVPSTTTLTYSNGGADGSTGAGGTVGDVWNGTFYVTTVPSTTTFTYQQVGANDIAVGAGTVTPNGQVSGGQHKCVVMFQTRSGYITAPCPPTVFSANGGQYLLVSNIPIGPANTVARVLAFTGKGGNNYFSILTLPITNNQIIATSTVISDNSTTSALLDFADATLFSATAMDIPGNNRFAVQVLPPCLGVFSYAGRLFAWGLRNNVRNFLNMGFDGGHYSTDLNPLGWTVLTTGGALDSVSVDFGFAWKISGGGANPQGQISQGAYQDVNNIAILNSGIQYVARFWAKASTAGMAGTIVVEVYSATSGVVVTSSIAANTFSTVGSFVESLMNIALPATVPSDSVLRVYANNIIAGQSVALDELEIIPSNKSLNNNVFMVSYVNDFESFDGVTGILGSSEDTNPLRDAFEIRDNLYFGTSERLHETADSASTEPSGWTVREVAKSVGMVSAFACTGVQEQNGEDFAMWVTRSGLRIFEGGQPFKISQEIQPDWDNTNWNSEQSTWLVNDAVSRRVYVGMPVGSATDPNLIRVLDYREQDTAVQVSASSPVHISLAGRLIASDFARKWTRWNLPMNCAAILTRANKGKQFCVGDGSPFGNAYYFDPTLLTDQNYGRVFPYYTTYFFVNHDQEAQLNLGSSRKLFAFLSAYISGVGNITLTPYGDALTNPWTPLPSYPLSLNPTHDMAWGMNVIAERVAIKIASSPLGGQTDNSFATGKLILYLKEEPIAAFGGGV